MQAESTWTSLPRRPVETKRLPLWLTLHKVYRCEVLCQAASPVDNPRDNRLARASARVGEEEAYNGGRAGRIRFGLSRVVRC